jgi:hypothetical protein
MPNSTRNRFPRGFVDFKLIGALAYFGRASRDSFVVQLALKLSTVLS